MTDSDLTSKLHAALKQGREDFLTYVRLCDNKYSVAPVHAHLAKQLELLAQDKLDVLVISMAPRHGKSRLAAVEFPTWLLGRNPRTKIAVATYAQALSQESSLESRERLHSQMYHALFPKTALHESSWKVDHWKTSVRGAYKAVGMEGQFSGFGVNYLIVDDAHKDWAEAQSPAMRDKAWAWFLSTARTRLDPLEGVPGKIICIGTRWHKEDVIGRATEYFQAQGMRTKVCAFPALAKEGDSLGRKVGEALVPGRFPASSLLQMRPGPTAGRIESAIWAALYDCDPHSLGGQYLDTAKLIFVNEEDVSKGLTWVRFWDLAAKALEEADFTDSVKIGTDHAGNYWLDGGIFGQWKWPQAREMIRQTCESEKILTGVEAQAGFATAYDNLVEVAAPYAPFVSVTVNKDKLTRALPWLFMAEKGKLKIVRGPWVTHWLAQVSEFPGGDHDDAVDATSGAWDLVPKSSEDGKGPGIAQVERPRPDIFAERPEQGMMSSRGSRFMI